MDLLCSKIAITWYPGVYPSATGPIVLLAATDKIDAASPLVSSVEQLVQRADYVRGASPDFWVRGGRSTSLQWDRIRPAARHDLAVAMAMETAEAMPAETGWLRVELPDYGRAWVIQPAAVRRIESRYERSAGYLVERWTLEKGVASEIATTAEDHAWLWEDGTEILWEDGAYLALETAP